VVQYFGHNQLPNFRSAIAFNVSLPRRRLGITLLRMFKSDRSSAILLSINAGVPLASLIVVVAMILRHMTLLF
jgi:hypothetical protein